MTTRVFVDGAVGTTGLEIADRLEGRVDLDIITLDDAQRRDAGARRDALNAADLVILCLPDDAAREAVSLIDNPNTRVIDASTAHRISPDWTFGFHEIDPDGKRKIAGAMRVSNPGCYPTGFLALIVPLLRAGIIPAEWPISINAVSGYSGGGKAMIAEFESSNPPTAWRGYALSLAHKHVSEMHRHSGLVHAPLFAPSVANTYRGMIVDVPLLTGVMRDGPTSYVISAILRKAYTDCALVNLVEDFDEANLTIEHAANTDRLDLFVFHSTDDKQVRLVAALDNLGKGAAGAAVQSLNLMIGVDEITGLRL
ncbi:MAG: N-acetyl-gamma-glutamyl-phosphate reductase [Pseudomonadota bacterium]